MKKWIPLFLCVSFLDSTLHAYEQQTFLTPQETLTSDDGIAQAIQNEFGADRTLQTYVSGIDVQVKDGVVTLSGTVNDYSTKYDFGAKANSVSGVRKVVNKINVK